MTVKAIVRVIEISTIPDDAKGFGKMLVDILTGLDAVPWWVVGPLLFGMFTYCAISLLIVKYNVGVVQATKQLKSVYLKGIEEYEKRNEAFFKVVQIDHIFESIPLHLDRATDALSQMKIVATKFGENSEENANMMQEEKDAYLTRGLGRGAANFYRSIDAIQGLFDQFSDSQTNLRDESGSSLIELEADPSVKCLTERNRASLMKVMAIHSQLNSKVDAAKTVLKVEQGKMRAIVMRRTAVIDANQKLL